MPLQAIECRLRWRGVFLPVLCCCRLGWSLITHHPSPITHHSSLITQVQELKQAKKMLGKQWFKRATARRSIEHDPDRMAAEQVRVL